MNRGSHAARGAPRRAPCGAGTRTRAQGGRQGPDRRSHRSCCRTPGSCGPSPPSPAGGACGRLCLRVKVNEVPSVNALHGHRSPDHSPCRHPAPAKAPRLHPCQRPGLELRPHSTEPGLRWYIPRGSVSSPHTTASRMPASLQPPATLLSIPPPGPPPCSQLHASLVFPFSSSSV